MTTKKRAAIFLGIIFGLYVLSYTILSPLGRYAPWGWDLIGQHGPWIKDYQWAPAVFYDSATGEWQHIVVSFYLPLWTADNWFWHTNGWHPELTDSPRYPPVLPASVYKPRR